MCTASYKGPCDAFSFSISHNLKSVCICAESCDVIHVTLEGINLIPCMWNICCCIEKCFLFFFSEFCRKQTCTFGFLHKTSFKVSVALIADVVPLHGSFSAQTKCCRDTVGHLEHSRLKFFVDFQFAAGPLSTIRRQIYCCNSRWYGKQTVFWWVFFTFLLSPYTEDVCACWGWFVLILVRIYERIIKEVKRHLATCSSSTEVQDLNGLWSGLDLSLLHNKMCVYLQYSVCFPCSTRFLMITDEHLMLSSVLCQGNKHIQTEVSEVHQAWSDGIHD